VGRKTAIQHPTPITLNLACIERFPEIDRVAGCCLKGEDRFGHLDFGKCFDKGRRYDTVCRAATSASSPESVTNRPLAVTTSANQAC
jgi:hypothetical protein